MSYAPRDRLSDAEALFGQFTWLELTDVADLLERDGMLELAEQVRYVRGLVEEGVEALDRVYLQLCDKAL